MVYFTASCDPAKRNKDFAKSLNLDYPILSDPGQTVAKAYGVVTGLPFPKRHTFIIGPDGKLLAIDRNVSPASHGADLAARLKKLGVAEKQ